LGVAEVVALAVAVDPVAVLAVSVCWLAIDICSSEEPVS
jgi:hypothetical protein